MNETTGFERRSRIATGLLFAILLLSVAVRLWGIRDHLPEPTLGIAPLADTVIDENDRRASARAWEMWHGGTTPLNLNPGTADWPGIPFYLTLILQILYRGFFIVTSGNGGADAFARHVLLDPRGLYLLPRIVTALLGALTVYLTYRVGSRILGHSAGLWAGLLLALNPTHVLFSQHISDPNILSLCFVLLATGPLISVARSGSVRSSAMAGAFIGLGAACKYVPAALLGSLALAVVEWMRSAQDPMRRRVRIGLACLACGAATAAAAFLITSPYTLLDWNTTIRDLGNQGERFRHEWVGQSGHSGALAAYVTSAIPSMLGWPAYLLALGGIALLIGKGAQGRILTSVPLIYVLVNSLLSVAQARFVLPALPHLLLAAAASSVALLEIGAARIQSPLARPALSAALAILLLAWPVRDLAASRADMARPDSRHAARRWIQANIPSDRPMAVDQYGPRFNTRERATLIWPFFASGAQFVEAAYDSVWLAGLAYYARSDAVASRFEAEPASHPREVAFYDWLRRKGRVVWDSRERTLGGPWIRVFALPDSISTPEERDQLWRVTLPSLRQHERFTKWCKELALVFASVGRYDLGEEWARRGLTISVPSYERDLLLALAAAEYYRGAIDSVQDVTSAALLRYPNDAALHLFHGMALEALRRVPEAVGEYDEALRLGLDPQWADRIRPRLAALKAGH